MNAFPHQIKGPAQAWATDIDDTTNTMLILRLHATGFITTDGIIRRLLGVEPGLLRAFLPKIGLVINALF